MIKKTTSSSYIDTGLNDGCAYFYKIKALNANGKDSIVSNIQYGYIGSAKIPAVINSDKIQSTCDSVVVVSTNNTTTSIANVSFYTKKIQTSFALEFTTIGYLGKEGIGKTKEGDGKTPIGIYGFSMAFGISEAPTGIKIPYTLINSTHWVVSDSKSMYYNKFVSTNNIKKDWSESYGEQLCKYSVPYNYSLFINYNKESIKEKGSAIFLHCYSLNKYTSGCISIPKKDMEYLLTKLIEKDNTISSEIIINTYNQLIK